MESAWRRGGARALVVGMLLWGAGTARAGTPERVQELLEKARALRDEEKVPEASRLYREAALLAQGAGRHAELATCLGELADLHFVGDHEGAVPELAGPLARAAAREAAVAGDLRLERACLARIAGLGEEDQGPAQQGETDCLVADHDQAELDGAIFMGSDLGPALEILDLEAEAGLAANGGDRRRQAARLLDAIARADGAGLGRTAAGLRLRLAEAVLGGTETPAPAAAGVPTSGTAAAGGSPPPDPSRLAGEVLAFASPRGDLRVQAAARTVLAKAAARAGLPEVARTEAREALRTGAAARDDERVAAALAALAEVVPEAERAEARTRAGEAEATRHRRRLDQLEDELTRGSDEPARLVDRLEDELRRRPDDPARAVRLLEAAGARPAPLADPARFVAAFEGALAGPHRHLALLGAEILERREAFGAILRDLPTSGQSHMNADALETLARPEDLPTLLGLLVHPDPYTATAAAGAIFRLAGPGDLEAVRKALAGPPALPPAAALWLRAVLARAGDPAALEELKKAQAGPDHELALHAAVALGRLGFAGPLAGLRKLDPETPPDPATRGRILARAPAAWGPDIIYSVAGHDGYDQASRAVGLQGHRVRVPSTDEERSADALIWNLPRGPAEAWQGGAGWICGFGAALEKGGDGDLIRWIAGDAGIDPGGNDEALKSRKDDAFAALVAADLEMRKAGAVGGPQARLLLVTNGSAWARVRVIAAPQQGELVDNTLRLPFLTRWDKEEGGGGGLLAALDRIGLEITLVGLFAEARIDIPGFPALVGRVDGSLADRILVSAELPVVAEGEGIRAGKTIDLEVLAQGTVTLTARVEKSAASMTFPLAVLVPPAKDKPDLVAGELVLEPPVPGPDQETYLLFRTRNMGKKVEPGKLAVARFSALNPQRGGTRRTVDSRVMDPAGWRPGEWREVEARPRFVKDFYMNRYSPTWVLEAGETRITATIDADGAVEETDEGNNSIELVVPLYLADEEAKRLAAPEWLAAMEACLARVDQAADAPAVAALAAEARALMGRAAVKTPELEVASRLVQAACADRGYRLRMAEALEQVRRLAASPNANKEAAKALLAELTSIQVSVLDTGVPIQLAVLNDARNRTQTLAGVCGARADWLELRSLLGHEGEAEIPRKFSEAVGRLDGVLQFARYARERAEGREAETGDVVESVMSIVGSQPGITKLHQALLTAEIDYVDKGFRKEAKALDALAALIGGEPGAQERLDAAVRDVDRHVSAGPFAPAGKSILQGMVKDVPVIGKLLDTIWSWREPAPRAR